MAYVDEALKKNEVNLFFCKVCKKWMPRDRFKFNPRGEAVRICIACRPAWGAAKRTAIAVPNGKKDMTDESMKARIEAKGTGFEALREAYAESLPQLGQSLWTYAIGGDMTAAKLVLEIAGKTKGGGGEDEEWRKLQRDQEEAS